MSIIWIMIGLVITLVMFPENFLSLLNKWEEWSEARAYRHEVRFRLGLLQQIEESIQILEALDEKKREALKEVLLQLKRLAKYLSASLPAEPLSLFRKRTREEQDWIRVAEFENLGTLQSLQGSGLDVGPSIVHKTTELLLLQLDLVESRGVLIDPSKIKLGPIVQR